MLPRSYEWYDFLTATPCTQLMHATLPRESFAKVVELLVWHRTLAIQSHEVVFKLYCGDTEIRVHFLNLSVETHPRTLLRLRAMSYKVLPVN